MATLRHLRTARLHAVPTRLLVGRSRSCALHIPDPAVSREHAILYWTGAQWQARDLGSRNGTWVEGQRLLPGEPVPLSAGVRLAFGELDDPWELVEASAPGAVAEELTTGQLHQTVEGLLMLPDEAQPQAVVYHDGRGRWMLELHHEAPEPIDDQAVLVIGDQSWRIHLPAIQEGTVDASVRPTIATLALRLAVSRDEEHVQATILHRGREIVLEPREHLYLLLTLARARLEDAALPPSEQGWVDRERLLRMLAVDANALNVAIYRARQQFSAVGVDDAAGVVEVRRGQRRLGVTRVEVAPM